MQSESFLQLFCQTELMQPNNLVVRTKKGDEEVVQNNTLRRMDKQLNTALFLVDGTRTRRELDEVIAVMKLPSDCVSKLHELGFVESGREVFRTPDINAKTLPASSARPRSEAYVLAKRGLYDVLQKGAARLGAKGLFNPYKIDKTAPAKDYLNMAIELRLALNQKLGVDVGDDFFDEAQAFIAVCEKEW
ncbi:hypothetical protein BH11PSE11_BH11PSE11_03580 [soil metagenome]